MSDTYYIDVVMRMGQLFQDIWVKSRTQRTFHQFISLSLQKMSELAFCLFDSCDLHETLSNHLSSSGFCLFTTINKHSDFQEMREGLYLVISVESTLKCIERISVWHIKPNRGRQWCVIAASLTFKPQKASHSINILLWLIFYRFSKYSQINLSFYLFMFNSHAVLFYQPYNWVSSTHSQLCDRLSTK